MFWNRFIVFHLSHRITLGVKEGFIKHEKCSIHATIFSLDSQPAKLLKIVTTPSMLSSFVASFIASAKSSKLS